MRYLNLVCLIALVATAIERAPVVSASVSSLVSLQEKDSVRNNQKAAAHDRLKARRGVRRLSPMPETGSSGKGTGKSSKSGKGKGKGGTCKSSKSSKSSGSSSDDECVEITFVCAPDDCIQQFSDGVLQMESCFNEENPMETVYNEMGEVISTNNLALMVFLERALVAGCRTITSGSADALLGFSWNCGFWEAGCGYTATWMRDSLLGLFIEFTPLTGTGFARYHLSGQECCTDWTAGHLVVRDFEMQAFETEECDYIRDPAQGPFDMELLFDHNLVGDSYINRSDGQMSVPTIDSVTGPTGCGTTCPIPSGGTTDWMTIGLDYTSDPSNGFTRTNCGQGGPSCMDALGTGCNRSIPRDAGNLVWYINTNEIISDTGSGTADPLCCSTNNALGFAGCNDPSYCDLAWDMTT